MRRNVEKVYEMIDSLTLEEKKIIFKRMQKDINQRLSAMLDKINRQAKKEPIALEAITEEVEIVRKKRYEENQNRN